MMAAGSASNIDLSQLESSDQTQLLNLIDELRCQGISQEIPLPQLIVVGNQSSGKSSVLNAITRLRFPTNMGCCTTFATELRLRRGPRVPTVVSIQAGSSRSKEEKARLDQFKATFEDSKEFPNLVAKARQAMCNNTSGSEESTIFDDVLCVEIAGPSYSPLTIVDLPGLIASSNEGQGKQEGMKIERLVRSYMANPGSIILAVIDASDDLALQKILDVAEEEAHDPTKKRTLGIITKPDRIEETVRAEHPIIRLAQNKRRRLQLGWHALRNRSPEVDSTDQERDELERRWFMKDGWAMLPRTDVGIAELCRKLTDVLLKQIRDEFPSVKERIKNEITVCKSQLAALGEARDNPRAQRAFLSLISQDLFSFTQQGIHGHYDMGGQAFFKAATVGGERAHRLRAVLRDLDDDFRQCMDTRGHKWNIADDSIASDPKKRRSAERALASTQNSRDDSLQKSVRLPEIISETDMINSVRELTRDNWGNEFPMTVLVSVVVDLFRQQSERWKKIATSHVDRVWDACISFLHALVDEKAIAISDRLKHELIDPAMAELREGLYAKLDELLLPYTNQLPIFLGEKFQRDLRAAINKRRAQQFKDAYNRYTNSGKDPVNLEDPVLQQMLTCEDEVSESKYNAIDTIDKMTVCYAHCREIFVNNLCFLGIETCLVSALPQIMSTQYVNALSDEQLDVIAGDSDEIRFNRGYWKDRQETFNEAFQTIDRKMSRMRKGVTSEDRRGMSAATHPDVLMTDQWNQMQPSTPTRTPDVRVQSDALESMLASISLDDSTKGTLRSTLHPMVAAPLTPATSPARSRHESYASPTDSQYQNSYGRVPSNFVRASVEDEHSEFGQH